MFQPVIPVGGLAGWRFLQNTYDNQYATFTESAQVKRDTEHFRDTIGTIETAEQLVNDRQLLNVALGAFGLQDDINNKAFVQKILEEGTLDPGAFANRFADARYQKLAEAFGFGPGEVRQTAFSFFADDIISAYERQSFEIAVGNQNGDMRIALSAERSFLELAESESSEEGKWFQVMGELPMRRLFETAFNLPSSFSQIDLDQQREILAERSERLFGTSDPAAYADKELQERLISRYTALSQIQDFQASTSGAVVALTLLSQIA